MNLEEVDPGLSADENQKRMCYSPNSNLRVDAVIRERRYRLCDNYSRYYLKFVERVTKAIDSGSYVFTSLSRLSDWNTVMGLQFENLVVNHFTELMPYLHLGGTVITSAAPYRKIGRRDRNKGCQVDLLLQAENMLYFVEAKRQQKIAASVVRAVDEKIRRVSRPDGYFDAVVPFAKLLGL